MKSEQIEKGKDIKEMEEKQQWWWVAEKTRSSRLDYLRKAAWKKGCSGGNYAPGIKVDLAFPQIFTETWKENEGEPIMLRKARALGFDVRGAMRKDADLAPLEGTPAFETLKAELERKD